MDKNPGSPEKGSAFNKIDLKAFEDFSFGTQWTEASGPPKGGGAGRRDDRRRDGGQAHRDRRPSRSFLQRDPNVRDQERPPRSEQGRRDDRRPDRRGGPQRERSERPGRSFRDREPYVSSVFEVAFYPEDNGFNAMAKAMRTSCRTYELFEIARLILGKIERSVVVLRRIPGEDGKRPQMAICIADGIPFNTEEEAVAHTLNNHLERFFDVEEIECDPPKGVFQVVHRCPVTKELLGPPNYHRYAHIVEQHHATKVAHIPLERFRERLISSREEADIQAWIEKMKKTVRYTPKADMGETSGPFDSLEDARSFLLRTARGKMVKSADGARIGACELQKYPDLEVTRAMEGALEQQRRFPLDTANALRGRLRRENFHIFKRGSKGITYACSVRRKLRTPGQTFADTVQKLIQFLEANPMHPVTTLSEAFLGISIHGSHEGETETIEDLPEDRKEVLKRMAMDLRWLVSEGYVAEFSDGRLLVAPVAEPPVPKKVTTKQRPHAKAGKPVGAVAPDTGDQPATEKAVVSVESAAGDATAVSDVSPSPDSDEAPDASAQPLEGKPTAEVPQSTESPAEEEAAGDGVSVVLTGEGETETKTSGPVIDSPAEDDGSVADTVAGLKESNLETAGNKDELGENKTG